MGHITSPPSSTSAQYRWRIVDIVTAAVLGVATGVLFWAWTLGYSPLAAITVAFPPILGLYTGGWIVAGVLGGLIMRKPGAAIFCELLAAIVEAVLGTHWGMSVLTDGVLQGVGVEVGFALFAYRRFSLPVAVTAGTTGGVVMGFLSIIVSYPGWAAPWQAIIVVLTIISGALLAGLGSWALMRALARTGALANVASYRAADESVF